MKPIFNLIQLDADLCCEGIALTSAIEASIWVNQDPNNRCFVATRILSTAAEANVVLEKRKLNGTQRPKHMKPSEILRKFGWCQGKYAKPGPIDNPNAKSFCIVGACLKARNAEVDDAPGIMLELEKLTGIGCAVVWNDTPGRTKEEVISLLEGIGW